jgi:hypothetical protein
MTERTERSEGHEGMTKKAQSSPSPPFAWLGELLHESTLVVGSGGPAAEFASARVAVIVPSVQTRRSNPREEVGLVQFVVAASLRPETRA